MHTHAHKCSTYPAPPTPHSSSSSFPCCGFAFDVQLPKGDRQQQSKQSQNQRRLHAFSSPIPPLHPSLFLPSSLTLSLFLALSAARVLRSPLHTGGGCENSQVFFARIFNKFFVFFYSHCILSFLVLFAISLCSLLCYCCLRLLLLLGLC